MSLTVHAVEYHRNGVAGEPFYACRFTDHEEGLEFVATVFPPDPISSGGLEGEPDWTYREGFHNPRVAVLALDLLPSVEFTVNSWRGDQYADVLYHAIMEGIGARV
jgi:hypothetical protein